MAEVAKPKKRIIVCGDSFASADRNKPGTHFSELLTGYGHEVINMARGGISNTGIGFQLETAITMAPNVIIFTEAPGGRIDVPIQGRKFYRPEGIKNFIYPYPSDSSTGLDFVGNFSAPILSDTIHSFMNPRPDLPEELRDPNIQNAVKQYFTFMYDNHFKEIVDSWIIGFWEYRLAELGFPFLKLGMNDPVGNIIYEYANANPNKVTQAVYHTDESTQIQVARKLNEKIDRMRMQLQR